MVGVPGPAPTAAPGPKTWERQGVRINSPRFEVGPEFLFRVGGISFVVLSAIFFVSTAINREWIGPTAQLILATLVSLGFIAQSFRFDDRRWRVTFAAGGAAGLFISGIVGHLGLDILSMAMATAWLGGAIGAFLGLSRLHNSQVVALLAAPATFIGSSLLVAAGVDSPTVMAATAATWSVALAVTCHRRGWFVARGGGAVIAGILSLGATINATLNGIETGTVTAVLAAIASIGVLAWQQAVELWADQSGEYGWLAAFEARVFAFFIPGSALLIGNLVESSQRFETTTLDAAGVAVLAIGLLGAVVVTLTSKKIDRLMLTLHQLASLGTVLVGLAILIQGPVLLVGMLAATVVSAALARETQLVEAKAAALLLGGLAALWSAAIILGGLTAGGLSLGEAGATGLVLLSLYFGLWMIRRREDVTVAAALVWGATLLWVASMWQAAPQAQMWISISWVAMSVAVLLSRPMWNVELARERFTNAITVALATLAITGLKLIFIDLVAVDILWRAGLFFLIGGTFLRLAFVLPGMLSDEPVGDTPPPPAANPEVESSQPSLM